MATNAYSEQVGIKRHDGGSRGETSFLYMLIHKSNNFLGIPTMKCGIFMLYHLFGLVREVFNPFKFTFNRMYVFDYLFKI